MTRAFFNLTWARLIVVAWVASSGVLGCGTEPGTLDEPGAVGAACTGDDECADGLTCITALPGGFCTEYCTRECPEVSLCVQVSNPLGGTVDACSPVCETDDDCRAEYHCVSVGRQSVCSL